jgi:ribosomal protein S28E/S33
MSNTGKLLEGFVAQIEKILVPHGITVTPNEKVFNDDGVQIAEFDIEIEGKIGTTKFKWLIECRDRPTQGSAPGAWIEQLVGRRDRFNYDKVIAVSTTGFAEGAKQYAEESGIEIRTVTEAHIEQIQDWFLLDKMTLYKRGGNLEHARLIVDEDESEETKQALLEILANNSPDVKLLLSTETGDRITVANAFVLAVIGIDGFYDDISQGGGSKKVKLRATYQQDNSHYVAETRIGPVRIKEILFIGEITVELEEIPIAAIKKYTSISSGEEIAATASFNFNVDGKPLEMSFHRIAETGETHIMLGASKDEN